MQQGIARIGGSEPQPRHENLLHKRKSNNEDSKPAIPVTTGFGVELSEVASENPKRAPSACEPFHEFIERGLSRGRNAMAIWQDLVAEGKGCALVAQERKQIHHG